MSSTNFGSDELYFVIIDLGLMARENSSIQGTPVFSHPQSKTIMKRYKKQYDVYSLCLSILIIESYGNENDLFTFINEIKSVKKKLKKKIKEALIHRNFIRMKNKIRKFFKKKMKMKVMSIDKCETFECVVYAGLSY